MNCAGWRWRTRRTVLGLPWIPADLPIVEALLAAVAAEPSPNWARCGYAGANREELGVQVGVRREERAGERRVAATPETVRQLTGLGLSLLVECGAGVESGYADADYEAAGAGLTPELPLDALDVLLHVRPLTPETAAALRPGTITIGFASPASELAAVGALAAAGVTSFALELVPRISRAQSMDALSSQSLVAGYRAVLEAALRYPRFFPLYMTAAGTIPPARVLVLGAGVAGLQAIGTAKRLGARVSANDIRAASADEVASMGGTFINLELDARAADSSAEGSGGYARELGEDRAARQRALLAPHVAAADVLITTAAIPGRAGPAAGHRRNGGRDAGRVRRGGPRRGVRRQRRGRHCRAGHLGPGPGRRRDAGRDAGRGLGRCLRRVPAVRARTSPTCWP